MATVLKTERGKRHDEYARLRVRIFDHYQMLALVGAAPGTAEHKLPPKLGHWHERHSGLVRAVDAALWPIVERIEQLLTERDPKQIKAQHIWLRRGDNFRPRSGKPKRAKVQRNPGEWPPRWK